MRTPALVVAVFAFLFPAAARADVTATLTPTTAFSVGNRQIDAGPSATRTYTLTSTGTDPLNVASVGLTGADAGQFTLGGTCAAGTVLAQTQTCTAIVAFAPTATGARSTTLSIATNGPTLTSAAITGTGRDLAIVPATLSFSGKVAAGAGGAQTVTITNEDTAAYTLGAVTVPAQFVKGTDTCSSAALAPAASCTVAVSFAPTSPGPKTGTLAIASFGPAPAAITGAALQGATSLSPSTRHFADAAVGVASEPQVFTVTNTGAGPLSVGAVSLGGDASSFSIVRDECSGKSLAERATCSVAVAFAPAAPGYRRASLRIDSTGARLEGRGRGDGVDTLLNVALASQPFARLQGDGGDGLGGALASGPCDVDGDGYDDVISGASQWSRIPATNSWEGAAYVTFGGPAFGGEDLAGVQRSIRLEGSAEGSFAGTGVGCADVNGDGDDDVLVGAWAYEYPGRPAGTAASRGRAYVVFGGASLRSEPTIDLGALGARGFVIVGPDQPEYDHLGYAVTRVGDLNGDGREDIAVMANTGDTAGRTNNGIVWVVPGQTGVASVDVSNAGAVLARIDGASPGSSVAPFGQMIGLDGVGDVNGDGMPDIGIGTYTATAFGRTTASGAAFAISGTTRGQVDLASSSSYLFAVGGAFAGHRLGIAIDGAGDVNGDGLADLVLGADSTAAANSDAAYVVYGSSARAAGTLLDSAALGTDGYRIRGATGDSTGFGVAGIGDADRDGFDDVAVGAYGADPATGPGAGAGWIIRGVADPSALALDTGLVPANAADTTRTLVIGAAGSRVDGQTGGERFGRSVAAVGDVDGNGATDVAFGSDVAFRLGRSEAGEVNVALLPGPPSAPEAEPTPEPTASPQPAGPPPAPPAGPVAKRNTALPTLSSRSLRVDTRGRVAFGVRCTRVAARCRGTLALRFGGRTVARAQFATDGRKTVRVTLPKRLRNRTVLRATAQFTVTADGLTGTVRRTLKITIRNRHA